MLGNRQAQPGAFAWRPPSTSPCTEGTAGGTRPSIIGKTRAAERFRGLRGQIVEAFPQLDEWITAHPLRVLEYDEAWSGLLAVLCWFRAHPCSGLYRRRLEIEGVDTKLIENHRQLLAELLELVLPAEAVVSERGASFDRRFGLREKPALVRFRLLNESQHLEGFSDLSVPAAELARRDLLG